MEQWNFRMADVSNLIINERSNVETNYESLKYVENKNWEDKGLKLIYIKGKKFENRKIASAEYRMDK